MKHLTRFDIRQEYKEISEAMAKTTLPLHELFLKAEDPSVAVLDFIEKVSSSMSQIKRLYAANAQDRNAVMPGIISEVNEIGVACNEMVEKAMASKEDPEDTNNGLDDGGG